MRRSVTFAANIENTKRMNEKEIIQIENEVFTKLVIDLLKQQRAEGKKLILLDRYEVERLTKEKLRKILSESKS